MHVAAVHRFPDATGAAFALMAWALQCCLQPYSLFSRFHINLVVLSPHNC